MVLSMRPQLSLANKTLAMREKIDDIKDAVDGHSLLQTLGFDIKRETGDELRCSCIIHGGDNITSFRFKKSTKHFSCYSHGCHEEGSDVIALVRAVRKVSFQEALEFLSEHTGIPLDVGNLSEEESAELQAKKSLRSFRRDTDFEKKLARLEDPNQFDWANQHVKAFAKKRSSYFVERGFTPELLDHFEVGTTTYFGEGPRATILIRDEDGLLVGISSRFEGDVPEDQRKFVPKYRNLKSFSKDYYLYNLNTAKEFSPMFEDTLVLVEGYTAVWRLWQAGIPIGVSCMGTHVSEVHRYLLSRHCLRCLIFFDGDVAGIRGQIKAEKTLRGFLQLVTYNEEGKEPSTYGLEELNDLVMRLLSN